MLARHIQFILWTTIFLPYFINIYFLLLDCLILFALAPLAFHFQIVTFNVSIQPFIYIYERCYIFILTQKINDGVFESSVYYINDTNSVLFIKKTFFEYKFVNIPKECLFVLHSVSLLFFFFWYGDSDNADCIINFSPHTASNGRIIWCSNLLKESSMCVHVQRKVTFASLTNCRYTYTCDASWFYGSPLFRCEHTRSGIFSLNRTSISISIEDPSR